MIGYLEKFNELPQGIRDAVSKKEAVEAINHLEQEYKISLATAVMRVMVKDVSLVDLAKFFVFENSLEAKQAEKLVEELKIKVFKDVSAHLGFVPDLGAGATGSMPSTALVRSSNFYFSPKDEEEVKELTRTMGTENKKEIEKKEINDKELLVVVGMISKELSFNFSSAELHKRFNNVILTYAKGIRNKLDTKNTLMKEVGTGGLGLNEALSRKSLVVADRMMMEQENNNAKTLESKPKPVKPDKDEPSPSMASDKPLADKKEQPTILAADRDVTYDFKALREKEAPAPPLPRPGFSQFDSGQAGQAASLPDGGGEQEAVKDQLGKKEALDLHTINLRKNTPVKSIVDKPSEAPAKTEAMTNIATGPRTANLSNGKKRVEDVKYVPKLTGPVDELKEMDILNFRRLNSDAKTATNKIIEKIKFLEDDSYEKRLAGIRAWRKSPANKLYLSIGQDSIGGRKGIDAVIEERQQNNKDYLTPQEFTAIMDMNKALRF
ncbi:hypothetical protein KAJ89_00230 [Candidatus Parcubacteria bacterium]|nr:hypothetical protein [Candidatus Parcubacteria bacterium]